jgi:hypothetical protein
MELECRYSPRFYTWPFSTQCAVDFFNSINWHKGFRMYMGYNKANRALVTICHPLPMQLQPLSLHLLPYFLLLLMRNPEARYKYADFTFVPINKCLCTLKTTVLRENNLFHYCKNSFSKYTHMVYYSRVSRSRYVRKCTYGIIILKSIAHFV